MQTQKNNAEKIKPLINIFSLEVILPTLFGIFGFKDALTPYIFSIIVGVCSSIIIANSSLVTFFKSTPSFVNIIFIFQLVASPFREDFLKNFINLFSFYLGLTNFNFIAEKVFLSNNLYCYFLRIFIIVGTAFIPLAPISFFVSGGLPKNTDNRFRILGSDIDSAGHGTAQVGFILLILFFAFDYLVGNHKPSLNFTCGKATYKTLIFKGITFCFGLILCIVSGTRLGIIFSILFLSILIIDKLPAAPKKILSTLVLVILLLPLFMLLLNDKSLIDEIGNILLNSQQLINDLLGLSIRLVNPKQYGLFSGRDILFDIHKAIISDNFWFGVGYPLPLKDYGWQTGMASSEAGLTSIMAKFGFPLSIVFFFPILYILSRYLQFSKNSYGALERFEIFFILSVITDCLYNGQLQNPYGIGSFYWIFILILVNKSKSRNSHIFHK